MTIRTFAAVLLVFALPAWAAPPVVVEEGDRPILAAFLGHAERSAAYCTAERMAKFAAQPEDIVWQGSRYIRLPLLAYRLTGDARYLDEFVKRCDALYGCQTKGGDGFLGWYGLPLPLFRHPDHPEEKVDCLLTSFEVARMAADFARVVRADDALVRRHGRAAERYLKVAEEHLVRKWDARKCYRDLGRLGAVYSTHPGLKSVKAGLTQPHNKHAKIVRALVSLYAATGRDEHLVKAVKLAARFKRCLALAEGHYTWNYWDPAGPWDVHPEDPAKWKHWIGAEHRGGYYALSLSQAVLLYEHGLVFDRSDIDRFVQTQTTVCWNGDTEHPKWARVDGRAMDQVYLCAYLAPFDNAIREMALGAPARRERLKHKDHSWQGSVVAAEYLEMKYLTYPRWRDGSPAEKATAAPFLAKPANQALLKELALEVKAPGYRAPQTPAQMNPGGVR